jgi:hypothetical protein
MGEPRNRYLFQEGLKLVVARPARLLVQNALALCALQERVLFGHRQKRGGARPLGCWRRLRSRRS